MATTTLKARYCIATKTESEWANSNPVLLKGEIAFSSDKGHIFKVGDGTSKWEDLEYSNQGPKGDKGATGTRGSTWTVGTACTGTSATGTVFATGISSALVNDMYLNSSTGYVYKCTTAGNAPTAKWAYVGSIKGATGAKGDTGATGATGTRGSTWTTGTACTGTSSTGTVFATGITSALVGDMYLNTSTGYVYKCTTAGNASTAKWTYVGSIKGATGAKGDTGATGATGATGKTGPGVTATATDVTITAANFTGSGPYTQTISVSGILTTDQIIIGFLPITASAEKAETKAFGCLSTAACSTNGSLVLTCNTSKPATNFKIRVLCFRTVAAA